MFLFMLNCLVCLMGALVIHAQEYGGGPSPSAAYEAGQCTEVIEYYPGQNLTQHSQYCYTTCDTQCVWKTEKMCADVPVCRVVVDAGCFVTPTEAIVRADVITRKTRTKQRCEPFDDFIEDTWSNFECRDVTTEKCDWLWIDGPNGDKIKTATNCYDDTHQKCETVCNSKKTEFKNWRCEEFTEDYQEITEGTSPLTTTHTACIPTLRTICDGLENKCETVSYNECTESPVEICIDIAEVFYVQEQGRHLDKCPKRSCEPVY